MSTNEVRAIADEAARFGKDVAAHAYGGPGAVAAITGGVRSLEHGPMLTGDEIGLIARHGVYWVPTLGAFSKRQSSQFHPQVAERQRAAFQTALAAGVRIAFGTDVGGYEHGRQMDEFEIMQEYGMAPSDIVRSATTIAAELVRANGRLGTVSPGAAADLIAVAGDPTTDIGSLRSIQLVIKEGRICHNGTGTRLPHPEFCWTPSK
jgi:imidazolonepropionase-like amidohydrolase